MSEGSDVTLVLKDVRGGSREAADRLLPLVYDELRRLAQSRMSRERRDHTLQATALVHEAYLRLVDQTRVEWQDRTHFFAIAAQAIRRILVDHARRHGRLKHGGELAKVTLDDELTPQLAGEQSNIEILDLDEALTALAVEHPDKAKVVEMRFFGGLTEEETAEILGVSTRTVGRYWSFAQAWLYRSMTS
jgi:RNA polymerase sigma factor (TIGR02999 family)